MKALVTGGTGFIGGHIVDQLIKLGYSVRCLVRHPLKADRLRAQGVEVCFGDITRISDLKGLFDEVDVAFHAAAKVSDWGTWESFEQATVIGTRNMLKAALKSNLRRFVHISSVDVYDRSCLREDLPPANENTKKVHDYWPYYYARAKMLAEREVAYYANFGVPATIIRPATVYGPRDKTIMPRVVEFLKEQPLLVKGCNPVIGLIYIDDLVDLCIRSAERQESLGRAYNASSDEDIRLIEFVTCICRSMQIDFPKRQLPYWLLDSVVKMAEAWAMLTKTEPLLTRGELEFFTLDQRFDISKAQRDLDWCPKVGFAEGFQAYLDSVQKGGEE